MRAAKTDPRADAGKLAAELFERRGETVGRAAFLHEMGKPPFSTGLGAAETLRIWNEAVPAPKTKSPRPWYPPAVPDPTGRDRWKLVRSLVNYGIRPDSLADCLVSLIQDAGWDKDRAIAWGKQKAAGGNRYQEPWIAETKAILAR